MKELDKPDLDLIKQENQGVRAVRQRRVRRSCAGSMKVATNAGIFAADLLQEQQRLVGASMNGCRPSCLLDARPLRFCQSKAGRTTVRACLSVPARTMRDLPAAADSLSTFTHTGEVKLGVGGANVGFGEAEFSAHDVGAFDERDAFVIGDAAGETFAAKAAIGGNDEAFGRDVFERLSDQTGDMLGRFDDRVAVVDDADADLLVGLVFRQERQVLALVAGAFEGDHIAIELQ